MQWRPSNIVAQGDIRGISRTLVVGRGQRGEVPKNCGTTPYKLSQVARSQVAFTRMSFHMKTHTFQCVFASRSHYYDRKRRHLKTKLSEDGPFLKQVSKTGTFENALVWTVKTGIAKNDDVAHHSISCCAVILTE